MAHLLKPKHNHPAETEDCDSSERWDVVALSSRSVFFFVIDTSRCHMLWTLWTHEWWRTMLDCCRTYIQISSQWETVSCERFLESSTKIKSLWTLGLKSLVNCICAITWSFDKDTCCTLQACGVGVTLKQPAWVWRPFSWHDELYGDNSRVILNQYRCCRCQLQPRLVSTPIWPLLVPAATRPPRCICHCKAVGSLTKAG